MVRFADAMELLADTGVDIARGRCCRTKPSTVLSSWGWASRWWSSSPTCRTAPSSTPCASGVSRAELPTVLGELRAIAAAHDLPGAIAVQSLVKGHAEAFAGLNARTSLGPVVLFGLGGVLVEVERRVSGRLLPLDEDAALALAAEAAGPGVVGRRRGQPPWPLDAVVQVILGLDRLWRMHGSWLASVDLNPLIVGRGGLVAVDALMIADGPPSR